MRSLEIRRVEDDFDIRKLRRFMLDQPQFYPTHNDWVDDKCLPRLESGQAGGWMVLVDGKVAGDAIYQSQGIPGQIELKNFRIDPDYRNRDIGHCLLTQVGVEGRAFAQVASGELTIVADISTRNFSGVEFFIRNGFHITGIEELYTPGQTEYLIQSQV